MVDPDRLAYLLDSHPELLFAPFMVFAGIGFSAMFLTFPKWALPPWYREKLKEQQTEKDGKDESTR